ncbi:MAG: translocation/assembly module TamB, partial [Muribaculaceae bacterium]|nr:translocation/assembly module TamB [Muribaculaceae bacterium]
SLTGFNYGKKHVGDFQLALDVSTNTAGTIRANTSLMVNGVKAITATGNLNDSTAEHPFLLDFKMIHFPLSVANPFLPQGTASLSGVLNGEMDITGDMANPVFNGFLDFDTTAVNVEMLGTELQVSGEKIPVTDNIVKLNRFTITGVNSNPLEINGEVDLSTITSPKLDLTLQARNMQIVGSKKQRKSQVYGKAFVDIDAKVKGSMQFLDVDAALNLLPGTNVTYVMADAVNELSSRSNQEMVKFVNFNDTTAVADADTVAAPSMLMNLDARLSISTGTTINVELDPQGKSKVQLQSSGTVNYTMDYMNDEHFTGRININKGFVRYAVPVIGEKSFDFKEGSYVEFSGDMLNPTLNILAYDQIRANVAQDGTNSRVVNFDVQLTVTG